MASTETKKSKKTGEQKTKEEGLLHSKDKCRGSRKLHEITVETLNNAGMNCSQENYSDSKIFRRIFLLT